MAWSENKWTIIAALGAILGVIVPVLLFVLSRDSKMLTVRTVSRAVVVDLTDPALASLRLTYNDVTVIQLTLVTIDVSNTGSRPIERGDFERALVVRFLGSTPVLAAKVAEKIPNELHPELNVDATNITIKPLLLNPGDRFRLTIHLLGDFTEPIVDTRISGVSSIQRMAFSDVGLKRYVVIHLLFPGVLTLAGYFFLAGFAYPLRKQRVADLPSRDALLIVLVLGTTSAFLMVGVGRELNLSGTVSFMAAMGLAVLMSPLLVLARRRAARNNSSLQQEDKLPAPRPPTA